MTTENYLLIEILQTKRKNLSRASKFGEIFGTETGYKQLDERKRLTAAKVSELLLVLEDPELPLHNNKRGTSC